MKRMAGETNEHLRHRIFVARSKAVYVHMREAAAKAKCAPDFDLAWLRQEVLYALTVVERRSCRYCAERITERTFSLDHRVPVGRGGTWVQTNVQIVCERCNKAKGNLTASEYQQLIDVLRSWPKEAKADVLRRLAAGSRALRFYFQGRRDLAKPTPAETLVGAREFV